MLLSRRHRRQGDPAQAPEQDLLPDLRRRARGGPRGRRQGVPARLRLVLPLLPRPRALPRPRHDRHRAAAVRRRRRRRSQLRRPPDAVALGPQGPQHRQRVEPTGTQFLQAVGAAEALAPLQPNDRARGPRRAHPGRRGGVLLHRRRHHQRRGVLGSRSTPPATSSCRWSSSSRTTATPSRSRSRCNTAGGSISKLVRRLPRPAHRRKWTAATRWRRTTR